MAAVRPMLASLAAPGEVPLTSERLVYEPKYDGIRALVAIEPRVPSPESRVPRVTIWSRNGHVKTTQFPDLAPAFARLAARRRGPLLLDGEIVALDERGRPASFTRLQPRIHVNGTKAIADAVAAQPVAFFAFDLLREDDEDLRRLPFMVRRHRLQQAFRPPARSPLVLGELVAGDGEALSRAPNAKAGKGSSPRTPRPSTTRAAAAPRGARSRSFSARSSSSAAGPRDADRGRRLVRCCWVRGNPRPAPEARSPQPEACVSSAASGPASTTRSSRACRCC
jgi:hypothetical protein